MSARLRWTPVLLAFSFTAALAQSGPGVARSIFDRAVSDFKNARINEAAAGFDQVAKLVPDQAPQLWQRGIALYYAGRFQDCREQFESHLTVNPNDVENAAWHFLCVARSESPAKAKAALLPVGPDGRVPMRQIYLMFRGELSADQMMRSAQTSTESQFYGHLYAGLYAEALGDKVTTFQHISQAADEKYSVGGYMHDVARVHLRVLQRTAASHTELWTFDRLDKLGNHPTKVLGSPRVIDSTEGKAVEFDGVDDALFVPVHPLAGAETFTWEVIFRPYKGGKAEQRFFHLQSVDPVTKADIPTRLLLETRLTSEHWYLDSFAHSGAASRALIDRTKLHPLDHWYHVAMVYDGKELRHYVNGQLQGLADVQLRPQPEGRASAGVRINLIDYFKGAIRLARFSRRALTPDEFLKLKPESIQEK
jgi:tetratricopeptide (TPR) repeat protein